MELKRGRLIVMRFTYLVVGGMAGALRKKFNHYIGLYLDKYVNKEVDFKRNNGYNMVKKV